ncbi:MAG: FtsX-like permease family protein [Campylobacteraceae bacterium]|jgi:putative ABC transport system permease protein|nr:FtsX-like permease family protein [Campylobacteraceae bacterium]
MLKLIWVDFKRAWIGSLVLIVLISATVCFRTFITLEERALRLGSAKAAENIDLIVGAAGSEVQLVLSVVYLQHSPLPLLDGKYYQEIASNPLTKWAAPIALGDFYLKSPIIGTIDTLVTNGGERSLAHGRIFEKPYEAVVGIHTNLKIGDKFTPLHNQADSFDAHLHEDTQYEVVGILKSDSTAWDRAIFVPIKSVWDIHRHKDNGDDQEEYEENMPISAIVIKPKSVSGAYQLRSLYKQNLTQAVFPAEVLARIYAILGDARALLLNISVISSILTLIVLMASSAIYLKFRSKNIAALRAFGASAHRIFMLVWFGLVLIAFIGMIFGTLFGFLSAVFVSREISAQQGFILPIVFEWEDLVYFVIFMIVLSISLLIPSFMTYRYSVLRYIKYQI